MSAWENNIRKVVPYVPGEQPKEKNIIRQSIKLKNFLINNTAFCQLSCITEYSVISHTSGFETSFPSPDTNASRFS